MDTHTTPTLSGVLDNILGAVGNTPMVRLNSVTRGIAPELLAKVEYFNPGGSVKERIALAIVEEAEQSGRLKPGGTIVESTSGNTGVGLAIVAAIKGYKTVFVMPDKMSDEKVRLLRAYGARVVITPTAVEPDDPRSYYSVANRIVEETPNAILANQYHNPVNPQAHYEATGPEIWAQTEGRIDAFVAGLGTGGTISGVGRFLKEKNPNIQIVGVDPVGSLLHDYFHTGEMTEAFGYRVEGIGEDFVPGTTDFSVVDDVVQVNDQESFLMARRLVREEGIFVGGSCGAAVAGALKYIHKMGWGPDKRVVVLLPDTGARYLSKIYNDDWMRENGYFSQQWCDGTAADVLNAREDRPVITVTAADKLMSVVELLKGEGISQAPVLDEQGHVVGVVREADLLNHMLTAEHTHSRDETIEGMVQKNFVTAKPETPIDTLMTELATDNVVLVLDDGLRGILTKIDVLDYVVNHCM